MRCLMHDDREAVGQCNTCSCGLCKECIHNFTTPICPECNLRGWLQFKEEITKQKIIVPLFGLFFGIALFMLTGKAISEELRPYPMLNHSNIFLVVVLSVYWIIGICTYYGWIWINELNKELQKTVEEDSIMGIVLKKTFKLAFALIFGVFIGPYKIYTIIQNNKKAEKMIKLSSKIIESNKSLDKKKA